MGDGKEAWTGRHRGVGAGVAAAVAFAVLTWTGWGNAHLASSSTVSRSAADGLIGGIFVAGTVIVALQGWRRHGRPRDGLAWGLGATLAGQALLVSATAIASPGTPGPAGLIGLAAAGVLGTVLVLLALGDVRRRPEVVADGFAIGVGLGLLAAGHLALLVPLATPATVAMEALVWLVVATHVVAVAVVVAVVPRRTAGLLAASATVVDALLVVRISSFEGSPLDAVLEVCVAGAGAAWFAMVWAATVRGGSEHEWQGAPDDDHAGEDGTRDQREQLHVLRSTVAGLVNSSALIEDPAVPLDVRFHMWESMRSELGRMQRLLSPLDQEVSVVDLDEALSPVLDMQRCKGRRVEMHTSGDRVHVRQDAVAEVVNILLDNAATHGGCDSSRVEVHRRDDDTVDISVTDDGCGVPEELRDRIFDWGDHRDDSPGEGIGLSMARRLMSQDGGSLRLVDGPAASGSTFVVSVPRVRQSEENGASEGVSHDARHCSG